MGRSYERPICCLMPASCLASQFEDAVSPVGELVAIARDVLCGKPDAVARRIELTGRVVAPAAQATECQSSREAVIRCDTGSGYMQPAKFSSYSDSLRRSRNLGTS